MNERAATVLEAAGLLLVSLAGWLVAPALGLLVLGLSCIAFGVAASR